MYRVMDGWSLDLVEVVSLVDCDLKHFFFIINTFDAAVTDEVGLHRL